MNISANTLFYFTDDIRWIIEMLVNGYLSPRYCEEKFDKDILPTGVIALPMKCFCDLPLSMILPHLEEYGCYGIGFSKKWGISIGASPLTYFADKSSPIVQDMIRIINEKIEILNRKKGNHELSESEYNQQVLEAISIVPKFLKPYKGVFNKGESLGHEKCYYNEREWRYVPQISSYVDEDTGILTLGRASFNDLNAIIDKKIKLPFSLKDIRYIIVKESTDVKRICKVLEDKHGLGVLYDTAHKIITKEQIENDF